MTTSKLPICPYCGGDSAKTTGQFVYPHVKRLNARTFYFCDDGHPPAWVGSHKRTGRPLGTLANAELRAERTNTHQLFDPLWQAEGRAAREGLYLWLGDAMGLRPNKCHIGMFDLDQCREAQQVIMAELGRKIAAAEGAA